ncbi:MAG: phosphohistidine phosphatase SixA [Deltaproteobacteria bacterium]|nr:MAG: phosphohistidine phosphatase SixA [Deltaproteobacteria bacterium]
MINGILQPWEQGFSKSCSVPVFMDFYLVRHGEAKAEQEDPKRPLSELGRREVESVARATVARGVRVSEVLHSDKLRAKQTAEILAESLFPRLGVRQVQGLSPNDDPVIAKMELELADEPLMLVGHLPHIGRLASLLISGDPERVVVDFRPAAIVCFSRVEKAWKMKWTLTPL